jgi:hypothetical protein
LEKISYNQIKFLWGQAERCGGSWNNNRRNARGANRNRNNPDNFNNNIGFRLFSHDFAIIPGKICHQLMQMRKKQSQPGLLPAEKPNIKPLHFLW